MEHFSRSDIEQIDPSLLAGIVKDVRIAGYLQTIFVAALTYDALITMDREVKYFWKLPRSTVDFVYFVIRYIGILGAVTSLYSFTLSANLKECNVTVWIGEIASWLTVVLTDYVLTIRVLALYSKDKTLAICLYLFLALETAAKVAIMAYGTVFEQIISAGAEGVATCGEGRIPPWRLGVVDWSVQIAFGVILMVLALYKATEYWRLSVGFKGFTLIKVLIVDQMVYFMVVIVVSVLSMLEFWIAQTNQIVSDTLTTLGNPAFLCVLGSRMLLNLKEAGERGQNEGISLVVPSTTVSDMEFGRPPANVETTQAERIISE